MKCFKRILSAVSRTKQKEESEEIRKLFRMLIISQERDESGLDHSDIGRGGGVKSFWIYLEGKISRV